MSGSTNELTNEVEQARRVQAAWTAIPVRRRGRFVRAMGRYLLQRIDECAAGITECTGKPLVEALCEVMSAIIAARYYARKAPRFLRPQRRAPSSLIYFNKRSRIRYEPYGVVGIITPWNYPLAIPLHELFTAILCGNAVVLKVATQARQMGDLILDMVAASGLPAGLVQLVDLPGSTSGPALIESGIDKLFFTGSTEVGRQLMSQAAERLLPLCLELGGNDAMIVLEDADIERAARGALWAGATSCGQSCGAVERIYAHSSIYDGFRTRLASEVRAIRALDVAAKANELGLITTAKQLQSVRNQLQQAVSLGCRIVAVSGDEAIEAAIGSKRHSGSGNRRRYDLHHPLVLVEKVEPSADLLTAETFGPVVALVPFETEDEAVAEANRTGYGLTASVWSANRKRARKLAERLAAGTVTINDHLMSHGMPETPWGGYKQSGIGRCHGREGFMEMTQPKAVVDDLLPRAPAALWWPPYSSGKYAAIRSAAHLLLGGKSLQRLAALPSVLDLVYRTMKRRKSETG